MEFLDPFDEIFLTHSEKIFKDKPPGCISYDSKKKRFRVQGPRPDKKHIGFYNTREIALEALNYFHNTGKKMASDRTIRKSGTGSITKKGKKYIAKLEKIYIGTYKTESDAFHAIITYKILGKKNKSLS